MDLQQKGIHVEHMNNVQMDKIMNNKVKIGNYNMLYMIIKKECSIF